MISLKVVAGSVAVAAAAGTALWWNSGADERIRQCEERAAGLSGLAVLHAQPEGLIRSDDVAAGCDVDKTKAYLVHTSYAAVDPAPVVRHVRELAGREGWRVTETADEPAVDPHRAALEAEKELNGRRLSLRLSFPAPNTYEVAVRE